jgi:hypothetical protein
MDATILAYAFGYLGLLKFLALVAVHFLVGWIFAVGGCLRRPRVKDTAANAFSAPREKANPFAR